MVFQPLNYIGQGYPLFITEGGWVGIQCLGWMSLITIPTPFTTLKETSVSKVL